MSVPPPLPCGPAWSFQTVPDHPQPRFTLLRGHLALLLLAFCLGTGCRATRHVVQLSQPHSKLVFHQVQRLDAAFAAADDRRLFLRVGGRMAGTSQDGTLLVALPPAIEPVQAVAQRIVVTSTAVQPSRESPPLELGSLRPVPVGPPLVFTGTSTYEWDRLRPAAGREREIRLVRRPGEVERWEVLDLKTDAATGDCRFTVFEVWPAQRMVRHWAALALVPLAMASDLVAVGTMTAGVGLFVMSAAPPRGSVLHG